MMHKKYTGNRLNMFILDDVGGFAMLVPKLNDHDIHVAITWRLSAGRGLVYKGHCLSNVHSSITGQQPPRRHSKLSFLQEGLSKKERHESDFADGRMHPSGDATANAGSHSSVC